MHYLIIRIREANNWQLPITQDPPDWNHKGPIRSKWWEAIMLHLTPQDDKIPI